MMPSPKNFKSNIATNCLQRSSSQKKTHVAPDRSFKWCMKMKHRVTMLVNILVSSGSSMEVCRVVNDSQLLPRRSLTNMFTVSAVLGSLFRRSMSSVGSEATSSNYAAHAVKPAVFFVLGGPGAGKGTQCANLVRDYKFVHLSAGDLLRQERDSGSSDGDLINRCIKEGQIVPVEITVKLLGKAMTSHPGGKFLIDGFPRNENNFQGWEKEMHDKVDLKGVLFFDCPEDICVQRIIERSKSSGRVDDNLESVKKRFQTFYNQTMPVVEYYSKLDLVYRISAIPEPSEVYEEVKGVLNKL